MPGNSEAEAFRTVAPVMPFLRCEETPAPAALVCDCRHTYADVCSRPAAAQERHPDGCYRVRPTRAHCFRRRRPAGNRGGGSPGSAPRIPCESQGRRPVFRRLSRHGYRPQDPWTSHRRLYAIARRGQTVRRETRAGGARQTFGALTAGKPPYLAQPRSSIAARRTDAASAV